ncbi:MAG: VOC family protein [Hyphomicrobiaceae bacterium]
MTKVPAKRPRTARKATVLSIAPHLVVAGAADAIAYYIKAFGAVEKLRIPGPNGKLIHAAIEIGGLAVMLTDEEPAWGSLSPKALKGTPVTIHLDVSDVDTFFARAVEAGATVKMPVADMFWGDRYGLLQDPFGHNWSIATHQRDMTEAELRAAAADAMSKHGQNCPEQQ